MNAGSTKKQASFLLICLLLFGACTTKTQPKTAATVPQKITPEYTPSTQAQANFNDWPSLYLEVQVPQRKLLVVKNGHVIRHYTVAVGEPRYPSPLGERKVHRVIFNPWWHPPKTADWVEDATPVPPRVRENPLGEIKMPLGGGFLIHGTKAIASLGQWASHGCIRMAFKDIFSLVQLVMQDYSEQSAIENMQLANTDRDQEFSINLLESVPVFLSYEPVKVKQKDRVVIYPDLYEKFDKQSFAHHVASVIKPHLVQIKRYPNVFKIQQKLESAPKTKQSFALHELSDAW